MFDLVNDIEAYPEFLHWCHDAKIERSDGRIVEASLDIGIKGIHKRFKTRNILQRPEKMTMELLSGPFRRLEGEWCFNDEPQGGCTVELSLDFEVERSPLAFVFSGIFEEIARAQLHAFVSRAESRYG